MEYLIDWFSANLSSISTISWCEHILYYRRLQVWTQKCVVQKASVDVNISYY